MSITTGEPPQLSHPEHVQLNRSNSPPNIRHLLARVVLHFVVVAQRKPVPFGVVPIGQVPSKLGVVQLPPAVGSRVQVKCSAFESRHRLPPVTEDEAEAINTLNETLALWPQLVPMKQTEKATPVAAAQATLVPVGPVRFLFLDPWSRYD